MVRPTMIVTLLGLTAASGQYSPFLEPEQKCIASEENSHTAAILASPINAARCPDEGCKSLEVPRGLEPQPRPVGLLHLLL